MLSKQVEGDHFMALTLRPSDEQQKVLEQCQALLGENTITKSVYRTAEEYIRLRQKHTRLEEDHEILQRQYNELLHSTKAFYVADTRLRELIAK